MLIARWDTIDFDFDLFDSVAAALDTHLARLDEWDEENIDADSWGIYDDVDHTIGLGFAAAQTYLAGVCRWTSVPKQEALALGPRHSSGQPIARVVNAAANYWKHRDEWETPPSKDKQRPATEAVLTSLGVNLDSYPLTNILFALGERRVGGIAQLLTVWRDELLAIARARRG